MFSGIIEEVGKVLSVEPNATNLEFTVTCSFVQELKVDQSVAHNGVCLTVTEIGPDFYKVTAIQETLQKTNLGHLKANDGVNLERCLAFGGRIDGHLVQGHVDQTAVVEKIEEENGSWRYYFSYDLAQGNLTVEKGSICVNGTSLTVVDSKPGFFSVAIIPYTYHNTVFKNFKVGDLVNLEFDILGKYVTNLLKQQGLLK
ncbi:MAG: riboflavin synthase [Luteibaculaceae bacterium]